MGELLLCSHTVQQTSLPDKLIEQPFALDQSGRRIEFGNIAVIEDDNSVGIEDRIYPMRNRDDCSVVKHVTPECRLQHSIGLHIDGSLSNMCQLLVLSTH